MRLRFTVPIVILLGLLLPLGVAQPAMAVSATITGHITLQGGGVAVGSGAIVKKLVDGFPQGTTVAYVNADGYYAVGGLSAGTYTVLFLDQTPGSNYHPEWWNDSDTRAGATYFTLGVGGLQENVDAVLEQGGSITVQVFDGPLRNAAVNANVALINAEQGQNFPAPDLSGTTTLKGITPGQYSIYISETGFNPEYFNDWNTGPGDIFTVTAGSTTAPLQVWLRSDVVASYTYFQDVPSTSTYYTSIGWMASQGISTGTPVLYERPLYKPLDSVSRQAMAQFLFRMSGDVFTPPAVASFADVAVGSPFFAAIEWMKSTGISTGTAQPSGLPLYKPTDAVSRQAMALFLFRYYGMSYTAGAQVFADVPPSSTYYNQIGWMYARGISTGTAQPSGLPLYKPTDPVSRQAMALFLYRAEH